MKNATLLLFVSMLLLVAACARIPPSAKNTKSCPKNQDALAAILLGEKSDQAGPLVFNHRLHQNLIGESGNRITCGFCHHEYLGIRHQPPRACGRCHISHDDTKISDLPFL